MPKTAPDAETRDRLNASLNELLDAVCRRLRSGWTIRLEMTGDDDGQGEADIHLEDLDGTNMEPFIEQSESTIWERVEFSRHPTCSQCGRPADCVGPHGDEFDSSDCRCEKCCNNSVSCEHLEPMPD